MMRFFNSNKKFVSGAIIASGLAAGYIYLNKQKTKRSGPDIRPEGQEKDMTTHLLVAGSKILQSNDPLKGTHVYFVGLHPMKDDPCHQMEAHHYCKQVNEEFAQCVLYDGNSENANLTGIEYIISENLYNQLTEEERTYWHPHNYEILSGQLVAPGLPAFAEKQLMKKKMNSYGKTYHTWRAKCWEGNKPYVDTLPKGEAILAWSFNHDDEAKPELIANRDNKIQLNGEKKRKERESLIKEAHPQAGVNYLASKFKGLLHTTPGVIDKDDAKANESSKKIK